MASMQGARSVQFGEGGGDNEAEPAFKECWTFQVTVTTRNVPFSM